MFQVRATPVQRKEHSPRSLQGENRKVDLVILAGAVGSRPAWARGVSIPLLPLPDSTVLRTLLNTLRARFGGACTVCCNGDLKTIADHVNNERPLQGSLGFLADHVPLGTAGCIKACEPGMSGDRIFVASGSSWLEDDPHWMVEQHIAQGNALTVFCEQDTAGAASEPDGHFSAAGLYCCDRSVLDLIPPRGYFDLKGQLVPALGRAGLRVGAVTLPRQTRNIVDWSSYLHAITRALSDPHLVDRGYRELAPNIWAGEDVEISSRARVVGPAFLGHGCRVADDAVVMGPVVLGDGSWVGPCCWLKCVVAPSDMEFSAGTVVADQLLLPDSGGAREACLAGIAACSHEQPDGHHEESGLKVTARTPQCGESQPGRLARMCTTGVLLGALLVWAFWYTVADLWHIWQSNADYSAGQLVLPAAAYMVVMRRRALSELRLGLAPLGLGIFALGLASNVVGSYYLFSFLENLGLVLCANGLVMSLLGWAGYRRIWYAMLFLFLMIPLPHRLHDAIMLPLQGLGARLSADVLDIIGVATVRYGHVLDVGGHQVAVAEACNGLRMALAFVVVAAFLACVMQRPRWQKVIVVLSSVPIALGCNVVRIVVSACLYNAGHERLAQGMFHDLAGVLMMPFAVGLVLLEVWVLSKLVIDEDVAV